MGGLARPLPGLPQPAPPPPLEPGQEPVRQSGAVFGGSPMQGGIGVPVGLPPEAAINDQITGYRYGRYRDNLAALRIARVEAYDEIIDALQRETGTRLVNPMDDRFWGSATGDALPAYLADRYGTVANDPVARFEFRVAELVRGRPELERYIAMSSSQAVQARADALRREVTEDFHAYLGRGDGGAVDQFLRGLALTPGLLTGALSTGSPEAVGQLAAGGAGRGMNLLQRFFAGAATNVVAQAVVEPAILEDARRMGEEHGADMIALDFALAALIGGTIEAAPAVFQRTPRLRETVTLADDVPIFEEPGSGAVAQRAASGRAEALIISAHQRDRVTSLDLPQDSAIENLVDEINANDRFVRGEDDAPMSSEARPRPDPREVEAAARQADTSPAPPAGTREMVTINGRSRPRTFERFVPSSLGFDPATFQYKRSDGPLGSTGRLQGVETWDSQSAGKLVVFESADGRRYVADGHQRTALAQRLVSEGQPIALDGYLYREADGWTAQEVRNIAAQKNLRETPGDVLDTAMLMRDAPELIDGSIPQSGAEFRTAKALARLSDQAFAAVRAGQIDARLGAVIGEVAGDHPEVHEALVQLFQRNPPPTLRDAAFIAREATMSAVQRAEHAQLSMFGDELIISGMAERAAIIRNAGAMLREDRRVFSVAERHSDALQAAGNVLAVDANARKAQLADALVREIDVLATRPGPVANLLREIAARAAENKTSAKVAAREFVDGVEALLERHGLMNLMRGSDAPVVNPPPAKIPEMAPQLELEARSATLRDAHDADEAAFDQALAEVAVERAIRGETGDVIPEDAIGNTPEQDLERVTDAAEALGLDPDFTELQVAAAILARPDAAMEAEARARLEPKRATGADAEPDERPATFADEVEMDADVEPVAFDIDDPRKLNSQLRTATLPELDATARSLGLDPDDPEIAEQIRTREEYARAIRNAANDARIAKAPELKPEPPTTQEVRDLTRRALRYADRADARERYDDAMVDLIDAVSQMKDPPKWLARRLEDETDERRIALYRDLQSVMYPEGRYAKGDGKDYLGQVARDTENDEYAPSFAGEALEAFEGELKTFNAEFDQLRRIHNAMPASISEPVDAINAIIKELNETEPRARAEEQQSRDALKAFIDEHGERMDAIRSDGVNADGSPFEASVLHWAKELLSAYDESLANKHTLVTLLAEEDAGSEMHGSFETAAYDYFNEVEGTADEAFAQKMVDLVDNLRGEGQAGYEALRQAQPLFAKLRRNLDELWDEWQPSFGERVDELRGNMPADDTTVERAMGRVDAQLRDLMFTFEGAGMDHGGLRPYSRPRNARFARGWERAGAGGWEPRSTVKQATDAARAAFPRQLNRLLETARLNIVAETADVPIGFDLFASKRDRIMGYSEGGQAWIIAGNVDEKHIPGLILHEVGVHVGMKEMLGEKAFDQMLVEVERLYDNGMGDDDIVSGWNHAATRRVPESQRAEEALAYAVQYAIDDEMSPGLRGLVQRIVNSVRAWFWKRFGLRGGALTFMDMRYLALGGLRHATRNQPRVIDTRGWFARGEVSGVRGNTPFHDARLNEQENKAVEMARNQFTTDEIADELDVEPSDVWNLLTSARDKGVEVSRATPGPRRGSYFHHDEWTGERLVQLRAAMEAAGEYAIGQAMAERTGLGRSTIRQRMSVYNRRQRARLMEPVEEIERVIDDLKDCK